MGGIGEERWQKIQKGRRKFQKGRQKFRQKFHMAKFTIMIERQRLRSRRDRQRWKRDSITQEERAEERKGGGIRKSELVQEEREQ